MTKNLSYLLTKLLSIIMDGLVRYCNTKTSQDGVNNMWIMKNYTSLLSSLSQVDVRTATLVQTFDFSTLYTSVSYNLLKSLVFKKDLLNFQQTANIKIISIYFFNKTEHMTLLILAFSSPQRRLRGFGNALSPTISSTLCSKSFKLLWGVRSIIQGLLKVGTGKSAPAVIVWYFTILAL